MQRMWALEVAACIDSSFANVPDPWALPFTAYVTFSTFLTRCAYFLMREIITFISQCLHVDGF